MLLRRRTDGVAGFFLTVEGIDGSGKSTQARTLAERLKKSGYDVELTREPGGAPGAEEIRNLVLKGEPKRWSPTTEMLLFFAARRDHVERTIQPALDRGAIVICDRFTDSTRAYQAGSRDEAFGGAGGVTREQIDMLHDQVIGLDPDLTLIFDMNPGEALARGLSRGTDEARFEGMGDEFQARMRETFQSIAADAPDRCVIIDASGDQKDVAERVWSTIQARLPR
ncbi:MAG: dTMP kinase [Pikeienuella sp.]